MAEIAELVRLMQQQQQTMEKQQQAMERQRKEEKQAMERQRQEDKEDLVRQQETLQLLVDRQQQAMYAMTSKLTLEEVTCIFAAAHSVSDNRKPQKLPDKDIYRLLGYVAKQPSNAKMINDLSKDEIVVFMKTQFDPKRFVVHDRFKFWSDMRRNPGETIQELAARIRQSAATCDFATIKGPQNEALRSRFTCSVGNEAVRKALFKVKYDELDFARTIANAAETEDAAKVAKDTFIAPGPDHQGTYPR